MKITDVSVYLAKEWRTLLFVVVKTDEGLEGIGESAVVGREKAIAGAVDHFRPLLIGQDPMRIEHLWQTLYRGSLFPGGPILCAAIAAIDIALWDLKGKALNVPVYELLGGRVRDRIASYTHIHGPTKEAIVDASLQAVEEGWQHIRWEIHYGADHVIDPAKAVRDGVAQWEAVRTAVGEDIELCYDVHTRLPVPDAIRFCREIEPFRPFFVEDPLRAENPDAYRRLRQQTSAPIGAGEQFGTKWQFQRYVEEELIDYARIDICVSSGLTEAMKIAHWCETHYIDVALHSPNGPVATATAAHFAAAVSNFAVQELPRRPGECLSDVITGLPKWENGYLDIPSGPGLGLEFDSDALKKYPFEISELPHLKRPDGTFTNW